MAFSSSPAVLIALAVAFVFAMFVFQRWPIWARTLLLMVVAPVLVVGVVWGIDILPYVFAGGNFRTVNATLQATMMDIAIGSVVVAFVIGCFWGLVAQVGRWTGALDDTDRS